MSDPLVTRDGAVAVLTIDRADKRNAMTAGLCAVLPGVLEPLAGDPGVRVLVVTDTGPTFCSGADISEPLGSRTRTIPWPTCAGTTWPPRPPCAPSPRRRSR